MICHIFLMSLIHLIYSTNMPKSILNTPSSKKFDHSPVKLKKNVYFSYIIEYKEIQNNENDDIKCKSKRYYKIVDNFPERCNKVNDTNSEKQEDPKEKSAKYVELEQFNKFLNEFDTGFESVEELCTNLNIAFPSEQNNSTRECNETIKKTDNSEKKDVNKLIFVPRKYKKIILKKF